MWICLFFCLLFLTISQERLNISLFLKNPTRDVSYMSVESLLCGDSISDMSQATVEHWAAEVKQASTDVALKISGSLLSIFQYIAALLALCTIIIVFNVLYQRCSTNPNRPPLVHHWIPIIGSTVTYGMDPFRFFFNCQAKVSGRELGLVRRELRDADRF